MPVAPEHAGGGPYYFAMVGPGETFGPEHLRYDEYIFSAERGHDEAQIPTLTIVIKNPRAGPLSAGRERWCFWACDSGTDPELLFAGQLMAIPTDLMGETLTLVYIAKPLDYAQQKRALAAELKSDPWSYDPIFIDAKLRDDPNTVLEAYSKVWHIDPRTGEITVSDYIEGEDGEEVFNAEDVPYDSVGITINSNPLRQVTIDMDVSWRQKATGSISVGGGTFDTFTGDGLLSDWPKEGASLGSGWTVISSSAVDVYGTGDALTATFSDHYQNNAKEHVNGDTLTINFSASVPQIFGPYLSYILTEKIVVGEFNPFNDPQINRPPSYQNTTVQVPQFKVSLGMVCRYDADRQRTERLKFTLRADLQDVLAVSDETDTFPEESEIITLSGADVGEPLDNGGSDLEAPIGDQKRRSYFSTDRGIRSLVYGINLGRAHLLRASRAVEITIDCSFERAKSLTCRKTARLIDSVIHPRIPGGQTNGKIISVLLRVDGGGKSRGVIKFAPSIGRGTAVEAVTGTPSYVDEGVLDPGLQYYIGSVTLIPTTSDIGYSRPIDAVNDDGLVFPLTAAQVVTVTGGGTLAAQKDAITAAFRSERALAQLGQQQANSAGQSIQNQRRAIDLNKTNLSVALNDNPIWQEIRLKSVTNGPFEVEYLPDVTVLVAPKQYDLGAA